MNHVKRLWTELRSSLWFVPTVVVLGSVAAALLLIETQGWVGEEAARRWPRVFGASAQGSRAMLSAIATSMITVAGVIFSVTIVALSLTSTQYSPRVLRNFMRDRPTQLVLGVFMGIFSYCLIVLRTIRGPDDASFIPSLAVLGGMGYAFGGVAFLIYFIHHVAQSIQASSIISRIVADTAAAIDRLFPDELGRGPAPGSASQQADLPATWTQVHAGGSGYVTAIDSDAILAYAVESGRVLRLAPAIGEFVVEGAPVVELGGTGAISDEHARRLRGWVTLGQQRTVEQDAGFGLQQLVDVAVKALSPGINDPTTACMCIDHLGALLARLAARRMPEPQRMEQGHLRVIAPAPDFTVILEQVFGPVLHHSRGDLQVLGRIVNALGAIRRSARGADRRAAVAAVSRELRRQLRRVDPPVRAARARRQARALER